MSLSTLHERWLTERSLCLETAVKYGLHSKDRNLIWPYLVDHEPYNAKVRKPGKEFSFEIGGKPLVFWNDDALQDYPTSEAAIITEGEPDALDVIQSGFGCTVSVPNGTPEKPGEGHIDPFDDARCAYLWRDGDLRPELKNRAKIILAVDGDAAGRTLQSELAIRIGRKRCFYVRYPKGCKDANDVLKAHGEDGVRKLIGEAKPFVGGVVPLCEAPPEPPATYFGLGLETLHQHLVLRRPSMNIWTGTPNSGKSQFLRWVHCQLAKEHGIKSAILAFEDTLEVVKRQLYRYVASNLPDVDADVWINKHFFIIVRDLEKKMDARWVEEKLWIAVSRFGCQASLVDPWGYIAEDREQGENGTEYISRTLQRFYAVAQEHMLIHNFVAHPRKLDNDDICSLYDINGSAAFRNWADHGVVLSRPNNHSTHVKVHVQKSRDQENMGDTGHVTVNWNYRDGEYGMLDLPDNVEPMRAKAKGD